MESQIEVSKFMLIGLMALLSPAAVIFAFLKVYKKNLLEKETKIREIEYLKQIESFKIANESEEREREKIARNLHDEIIPTLSSTLRSVEVNILDFEKGNGSIDKLKNDALEMNRSIVRIRSISHDLAPPELLKFGVFTALKHCIKRIEDGGNYQTDFEDKTEFAEKPPFTISEQMNIYRLCLEIINNLNKHGAYTYLKTTIEARDKEIIIDFTHDGNGIANEEIENLTETSLGLGLKSLKSRALLLNANINYSFDDELANVKVTIPF